METPINLLLESENQKFFQSRSHLFKCTVCKDNAKYICPKCKFHYCNLECYKTHNENCLEEFYKENVIQALKNKKSDKETQKKMEKILKKEQEDKINDQELEVDESIRAKKIERLNEILIKIEKNEISIDDLKIEEQKEFYNFLNNASNIKKYIKVWIPDWEKKEFVPNFDIEDLTINEENNEKKSNKLKNLILKREKIIEQYKKLPSISKICQKINPDLKHHIINLSYGIVFILRYFNGDIKNNYEEAFNYLTKISPVILNTFKKEFLSTTIALNTSYENILRCDSELGKSYQYIVLYDLLEIFETKFFIFEIFVKIYDFIHYISKNYNAQIYDSKNENIKICDTLKQKIIFYMSFIKENLSFAELKNIKIEIQKYIEEIQNFSTKISELEKMKNSKLII